MLLPHVHSNFSFMWGANHLGEIFAGAARRGWGAVAITDINNLCGLHEALRAASAHGVRLVVGADLRAGEGRAAAIAATGEGFANLCRAVTACRAEEQRLETGGRRPEVGRRRQEGGDRRPLDQLLAGKTAGLVLLAPDVATAAALKDAGARVCLEIARPEFAAVKEARALGIPAVAGSGVTFVEPADRAVHLLLRAIAHNTALSAAGRNGLVVAPASASMPSLRELEARFAQLPQAFKNLRALSEECAFEYRAPAPEIPAPDADDPAARLRALAYDGAIRRYGTSGGPVRARMEHELALITQKGFAGYFLIIKDIVDRFPRTCGRGSGAASLVAYSLGITNVDPIRHNLYFERFLNPGRVDPPDIDVDFAWDERDDVLAYTLAKYGAGRAAMIATHITFRPRMAIREVARVYGLSDAEIGRVTKRLPWFWRLDDDENEPDPEGRAGALIEEIKALPQLKGTEFPPPWPEIVARAARIVGYPRHLSVHCGGVVITPGEITARVPVERAPKGVPIVQWEKDGAEDFGLVKIDLLGNRSLAVIRDAIANLRANGAAFDEERWDPEGDQATIAMIARGDTMGVFYVESPAMRQLQKKTGKGDFEHLVIHSSIIRPAANTYIREYVRRLRGGAWAHLHPLLAEVLSETYGIMCYQEDVSRAAIAMAGFTHAEGDALRKVLSKKDRARRLPDFKARFLAGTAARGVDGGVAEKVWEMMESFAGYSFCKPHSASYAKVSFQSAYLRAHHPAEFIAAVVSNQGGYYTAFAYVSEAARMGLVVLPPDVNASVRKFTGSGRVVRTGLMQVRGLSSEAIDALTAAREGAGPFCSIDDFVRRVKIDRAEVEALALVGAFDSVAAGLTRPQLLWRLCELAPRAPKRGRTLELALDDESPAAGARPPAFSLQPSALPSLPEYTPARLRGLEFERLGFLCSDHPLKFHLARRPGVRYVKGTALHRHVGRRVSTVGWLVTAKLVYSKHGDPMEFVSFEDTDATYEATFFPEAFRRFAHMLDRTRPYLLSGKVDEDFGAVSLTVDHVEFL